MSAGRQNPSQSIPPPDLNAWLMSTLQDFAASINCITHGTIQEFDAATQTATVAINYLRVISGANSGLPFPVNNDQTKDIFLSYPLLVKCPLVIMRGGGGSLTFPIAKGDECLLLFNDREIDTWFTTGQVTAPQNIRTHDLNDGWALVGIGSMKTLIADYDATAVQLKYMGASLTFDSDGHASLTDVHGERLAVSGDMKPSLRTTNHSGWLIMDGKTLGNDASGADYVGDVYEDLFEFVKDAAPNTGAEVWADGDTVVIPDMRGRTAVGADNMGGVSANVLTNAFTPDRNVLGALFGEQTHTLDINEMPAHHHTVPGESATQPQGGPDTTARTPNSNTTIDTSTVGGGLAHYNVQPSTIIYWFVKI